MIPFFVKLSSQFQLNWAEFALFPFGTANNSVILPATLPITHPVTNSVGLVDLTGQVSTVSISELEH